MCMSTTSAVWVYDAGCHRWTSPSLDRHMKVRKKKSP
jgi:hypothetical protein